MLKRLVKDKLPLALVVSLVFSGVAISGEAKTKAELAAKLEVETSDIGAAPLDNLYEISVGPSVVYLSKDGRFMIQGDIIDLDQNLNLTEQRRDTVRAAALDGIGEDRMIVFTPQKTEHTITVFTDIDCGYCRKLHREIEKFTDLGMQVRYMFFPRTGPGTESWKKAERVWCSADRNEALTLAKQGADIMGASCEYTPIEEHYELGRMVGLRGTPAIVTETGRLIAGYVPPEALAKELAKEKETLAAK